MNMYKYMIKGGGNLKSLETYLHVNVFPVKFLKISHVKFFLLCTKVWKMYYIISYLEQCICAAYIK